jgi:hypothetical protein
MFRSTATLLSSLMLATASVAATESDETPVRIRYGFMVATERCAACHIASLHQTLKPLYDTPKFEDIANRPTTTREHWSTSSVPRMGPISHRRTRHSLVGLL